MIWGLIILAIIIVALARILSAPTEIKMSREWRQGQLLNHQMAEDARWGNNWK